jgi:hypothetical protein
VLHLQQGAVARHQLLLLSVDRNLQDAAREQGGADRGRTFALQRDERVGRGTPGLP